MRFDSDFLKTLEQLRLVSAAAFAGAGRGDRRGRERGRGIEFADYRPYAQGDDIRHVDWKAYKRLGRLVLRLFSEEQDLRVYLFVDTSASMASSGKFDQALRVAAALCYIGAKNLDRVSLMPFAESLGADVGQGDARHSVVRVFELLDRLSASGHTDLWQTVSDFHHRNRRRGLAVVLSDFLDPAGCERPLRLLSTQGHEVVALHMISRADRAIADVGDVAFVDAETGERESVDVTPALLGAYQRAWDEYDLDLQATCRRNAVQYQKVDVDVPFDRTVLQTLRQGRLLE
jgi:uncharacterized protein (DUF58 family)